ncbi:MAG: thermonuclease family protein, partial [Bradyrhizobium sp.]|nr:thermonuclease family protein [Bradyrhizobium sp.]
MPSKFALAIAFMLAPQLALGADVTGAAKIREADQVQIGSSRIHLSGIDAPSV